MSRTRTLRKRRIARVCYPIWRILRLRTRVVHVNNRTRNRVKTNSHIGIYNKYRWMTSRKMTKNSIAPKKSASYLFRYRLIRSWDSTRTISKPPSAHPKICQRVLRFRQIKVIASVAIVLWNKLGKETWLDNAMKIHQDTFKAVHFPYWIFSKKVVKIAIMLPIHWKRGIVWRSTPCILKTRRSRDLFRVPSLTKLYWRSRSQNRLITATLRRWPPWRKPWLLWTQRRRNRAIPNLRRNPFQAPNFTTEWANLRRGLPIKVWFRSLIGTTQTQWPRLFPNPVMKINLSIFKGYSKNPV